MSVLEMKNILHQIIANTDDSGFLKMLLMVVQDQQNTVLDWEQLPDDLKESITKGLEQLDSGNSKSHSQIIKKYKAWLQK